MGLKSVKIQCFFKGVVAKKTAMIFFYEQTDIDTD